MSILNMCMNIGSFKIDINVNRDEDRKNEISRKYYEHDMRIKEVLELRNSIEERFNMNNLWD